MTARRPAVAAALWCVALASSAVGQVTVADVDLDVIARDVAAREGVAVLEVARSAAGRPVVGWLVGLPGDVPVAERPRVLVVAGMHADHPASVLVASRLPAELLDAAAADPARAALLRRHAVEIVPCLAVDAVHAARAESLVRTARTNARPVDDDRDGVIDEDGPNDLDGDGVITQIRVLDPLGEWRVSDEDPRLLVKADRTKGEIGAYRLESEGIDDDGDGVIDEDPKGGVDLDRNFPHGWREFDRRAGHAPCSEPEVRGLVDHLLAHRNVAAVLVLGHRDSLVEVPPVMKAANPVPDGPEADDRKLFEAVSDAFKKQTSFSRAVKDAPDGALHQWAYFHYGVPAFAAKVFEVPQAPPPESLPSGKKPESDDAKRLVDAMTRLSGKGFVPWRAFRHPTLGDVEIGGFVPNADAMPAATAVTELARAQARFLFDLMSMLPSVSLHDVTARALGGGLHEVTAVVRNDGRMPTVLRIATRMRSVTPSRVIIDLPQDAFELGERQSALESLGGGGDGRKLRWIVRAPGGTSSSVSVWTEKAGRASATLRFEEAR